MLRLFVAIPLSDEVKTELAHAQQSLMRQFRRSQVNWVAPENFHITVQFIGDVVEEKVAQLQEALHSVRCEPFALELGQVSAFPHPKRPQILVVETSTHPSLFVLHRRVANALLSQGLPIDTKKFTPHITLGRVKVASETLSGVEIPVEPIRIEVGEFVLMESFLGTLGAHYEPVLAYIF